MTAALAAALLTPDSLPYSVTESYGYRIARGSPTSREPQGRMLAVAGRDIYGEYVSWAGSHFIYLSGDEIESVFRIVAGARA